MLWSEQKHIQNLDKIQHHKKLIKILGKINKQNFPNLYMYGPIGSGKKTLVSMLLKHILGFKHDGLVPIQLATNSNIYFLKNNYYYYIDLLLLGKKPQNIFIDFIESIINTKNISGYHHVFVFANIEYANKNFIRFIKYYLNTKTNTTKFIFISNILEKANCVHQLLISYCMSIKVRKLHHDEIFNILKSISPNKQIKGKTYKNIIDISGSNLSKAIFLLQLRCGNVNEFTKYIKRQGKKYGKLYKLITKIDISGITKIRKFIYDMVIKNVDSYEFIYDFTKYILQNDSSLEQTNTILKIANKTCRNIKNSKEILLLEYFLISISCLFLQNNSVLLDDDGQVV